MTTFSTEIEVLSYSVLKYYIKGKLSDYFKDVQVQESWLPSLESFKQLGFIVELNNQSYILKFPICMEHLSWDAVVKRDADKEIINFLKTVKEETN